MPTLREHIYRSRSAVAEAQHNVMHTTFLVLRSKSTVLSREDLQQGMTIFNTLFNKFWSSTREVRSDCYTALQLLVLSALILNVSILPPSCVVGALGWETSPLLPSSH